MTQDDSEKLNDMDFEQLLAKRMVQNRFFGDYRGENIEWPEVFDVPDYSLLVANELVPAIGLPPPDGNLLCFNALDIDEIFEKRLKIYEDELGVWHYILEKDE